MRRGFGSYGVSSEKLRCTTYFEKYFTQSTLAERGVLQVESIKPLECCLLSVHVERVDVKVVCRQAE